MAEYIKEALHIQKVKQLEGGVTVGEVVDTNDPLQQGRLRVLCPAYGDSQTMFINNVPWAMYASPFAGSNEFGPRGRGEDQTDGPVAYGMFNVPKVGAQVLVTCIDGDPKQRVWFAALYRPFSTHTLAHGRYVSEGAGSGKPEGPLSSTESPINPLYDNQTDAFGGRENFEWKTRGADGQASFLKNEYIGGENGSQVSKVSDDREQGYGKSRIEPYIEDQVTDGVNWDPQTYSWTSPGFHSIAMHDRKDNCRMRFRTTGGTQIILDDTNERIYISTAKGKSWIEIDEQGPIYIYSEQGFSVNGGEADINFTTKGSFRVNADKGVHMNTEDDIRLTATKDIHVKSQNEIFVTASSTLNLSSAESSVFVSATEDMHLKATAMLNLQSTAAMNIKSGSTLKITSSSDMDVLASSGQMRFETPGGQIHFNGPSASAASNATPATSATPSFVPSIKPDHEPWARSYTSSDTSTSPEYGYDDANVGRGSSVHNITLTRNPGWRR